MEYKHFSVEEREIIQRMTWEKYSMRAIAHRLKRSHTSVSREIKRNNPRRRKRYTPRKANERALEKRKCRGREHRLKNDVIRTYVIEHLKEGWSPEQISGRMKKDKVGSISHEAIYQFVYAQIHRDGYGQLKTGREDLRVYLRRKQKRRRKQGMRRSCRVLKPKGPSIEDRPLVVERRSRIGDWEGDTVESCNYKPGVNTLLERKSGVYLVTKVASKTSLATAQVVKERLLGVPAYTLTLDNGSENQGWKDIEDSLGVSCFFAHTYSSYERGANENANGLLREYFPKGTDFTKVSDAEIREVEYRLNTRPRKRLGYSTPLEVWSGALGS